MNKTLMGESVIIFYNQTWQAILKEYFHPFAMAAFDSKKYHIRTLMFIQFNYVRRHSVAMADMRPGLATLNL